MSAGRCRSCQAEIEWVIVRESGKRMPIDLEPPPFGGNVAVHWVETGTATAVVLTDEQVAQHHGPLYTSHFATCPNANDWRRR